MEDKIWKDLSKNYTQIQELDLRQQSITDLSQLCKKVFKNLPNLRILNLSENSISHIPPNFNQSLPQLETLNLNNNKIDDIFQSVDILATLPNLKSLFINLNKEAQVDYILKVLVQLEHLNGLPVDREELYESGEREDREEVGEETEGNVNLIIPNQNQVSFSQGVIRSENEEENQIFEQQFEQTEKLGGMKGQELSESQTMNHVNNALMRHEKEFEDEFSELIKADEFEQIAEIYDQIRIICQKVNPLIDLSLAQDFDNKLKQVMEDLSETVNNPNFERMQKKEKSLRCKSQLFDLCSNKLSQYFKEAISKQLGGLKYEFSQIQKIFLQVTEGYKSIIQNFSSTCRLTISKKEEVKLALEKTNFETQQLLEAAEVLEAQNNSNMIKIEQLTKEKQDLQTYVKSLEEENKKYLSTIIRHSKSLESKEESTHSIKHHEPKQDMSPGQALKQKPTFGGNHSARRNHTKSPLLGLRKDSHNPQNQSVQQILPSNVSPIMKKSIPSSIQHLRNSSENQNVTNFAVNAQRKKSNFKSFGLNAAIGPTQQRTLSLKQLKDLIQDMYTQKTKYDQKCEETKQPKETMEQYMYTYLNQRYGLKNLIIEWAAAIITGIKKFSKEDHDVALFGKILRNECDEEFRFIQVTVKEVIQHMLKAAYKEKYPSKSEEGLNQLVEHSVQNYVDSGQWRKIIEKMYDEQDFKLLESQILFKIQSMKIDPTEKELIEKSKNKKLSRVELQAMMTENQGKIKFSIFQKLVLDFQLKEHEKFLSGLLSAYKVVDQDHDGIINEEGFKQLVDNLNIPCDRVTEFLQIIDPYNHQKITFSECVHLFSSESIRNEYGEEMAIIEFISNLNRQ